MASLYSEVLQGCQKSLFNFEFRNTDHNLRSRRRCLVSTSFGCFMRVDLTVQIRSIKFFMMMQPKSTDIKDDRSMIPLRQNKRIIMKILFLLSVSAFGFALRNKRDLSYWNRHMNYTYYRAVSCFLPNLSGTYFQNRVRIKNEKAPPTPLDQIISYLSKNLR